MCQSLGFIGVAPSSLGEKGGKQSHPRKNLFISLRYKSPIWSISATFWNANFKMRKIKIVLSKANRHHEYLAV